MGFNNPVIQNDNTNDLSRFIYVPIMGHICERLSNIVHRQVYNILEKNDTRPILLYISSYGGIVEFANKITNLLKFIPNEIYVVINGECMSCAAPLAMIAPFKKRYALPNSNFTIHSVMRNNISDENLEGLKESLTKLKETNLLYVEIFRKSANLPEELLKKSFIDCDGDVSITNEKFEEYKLFHNITSMSEIN